MASDIVSFLPFAALLLAIAVFPLLKPVAPFWDRNRNKLLVALALGGATLLHAYLRGGLPAVEKGLHRAVLEDYVPFICLLFALYTIAGGIHLGGDLRATPAVNSSFLAAGAVLASFIGTTGASMLLIRPLLRTNRQRRRKTQTVIFFIFLVSNIGGCLTPLGDPPLFLGYLHGVPFWWTLRLGGPWLAATLALLALYYVLDSIAYGKEEERDIAIDVIRVEPLRVHGAMNLLLLAAVVACVALVDPDRPLPGTALKPPLYLRELVLLLLAGLSYRAGGKEGRERNEFTFGAMGEVAFLFLGIFICMQPPLEYLRLHGGELGLRTPVAFFWASGGLSSFLDNAPTYMVFFETARGIGAPPGGPPPALPAPDLLLAISLGSVYMGANTYIGNGPNFMVKTIAERSGVAMPSFFGYVFWSGTILIPLFLALTFIFLR